MQVFLRINALFPKTILNASLHPIFRSRIAEVNIHRCLESASRKPPVWCNQSPRRYVYPNREALLAIGQNSTYRELALEKYSVATDKWQQFRTLPKRANSIMIPARGESLFILLNLKNEDALKHLKKTD